MIPYVRRQKILAELEKRNLVYIQDLGETLNGISEATIRRDLKRLEDEGHIELLHGGAAKLRTSSYDVPFLTKDQLYTKEKEQIAHHAAGLVENGDVIYLDSGTTTLRMVKHLKSKRITVVTSNTQILALLKDSVFHCILLGGDVSSTIGSVSGPITELQLSRLYFDKAFLGASGYSQKGGINTPDPREGRKKRLVMQHSKKTFVLMDSSKANRQTFFKALDFNECIIITEEANDLLESKGQFVIAPPLG